MGATEKKLNGSSSSDDHDAPDSWSVADSEAASSVVLRPQKRLLTRLFPRKLPPIPTPEERKPFPFRRGSILSDMFFLWLLPLMKVGYMRTLEPDDLFVVDGKYDVENRYRTFDRNFRVRVEKAKVQYLKKKQTEPTPVELARLDRDDVLEYSDFRYPKMIVFWALVDTFGWDYSIPILHKFLADIANGLNPLLARALIAFVHKRSSGMPYHLGKGVAYAICSSFLVFFAGINIAHFFHSACLVGAEVKAVLTKALLDKSLRLNSRSKHQFPPGKITALLGADLSRIDLAANFFPFILLLPVGLVITLVLLIVYLGAPSLAGIGLFFLTTGSIAYGNRPLIKFRKAANKYTDARVNYIKELLINMRIIKYYSWESPYEKLISGLRSSEMNILLKMQVMRNFITAIAICSPTLSSMVGFVAVFGAYGLKGSANVFASLTLFNLLSGQISLFPVAMSSASDALIALERVRDYLQASEVEDEDPGFHELAFDPNEEHSVQIKDAVFEWTSYAEKPEEKITDTAVPTSDSKFSGLQNINLDIKSGEFVVITGLIGSGKSSLLSAIFGVMPRTQGEVTIRGSQLLCGAPWIQNTTVRENILFGQPFVLEKYRRVIAACALTSDLDLLEAGDHTEIGERGVTLSGGQKARICLARAVYADTDIILLDDVLSAVDARVGRHIMEECFNGILAQKTRVLATHQLSLIGTADRIVFLNGDGSIDVGTVEELNRRNPRFVHLMGFGLDSKSDDEEDLEEEEILPEVPSELMKVRTTATIKSTKSKKSEAHQYEFATGDGVLIQKENRSEGAIPILLIKKYIELGTGKKGLFFYVPLLFVVMICTTFCQLFSNVWLAYWTENEFPKRSQSFYYGLYVMFTLLFVLFTVFEFCLIVYVANEASRWLNIKALQKMVHTPMAYMDTTPMGRILNRFTRDTDVLDNEIAEQARLLVYSGALISGIFIMCMIYLPWFAISLPFIAAIFVCMINFYQASARDIKRIESVQRSLVYSNFDEVLNGNETIKAYNMEEKFVNKGTMLINKMNEAYFLSNSNQRWLGMSLHGVSAILNIIITLLCVFHVFKISASASGLLVSYVMQISNQMIVSIKSLTQLENHLDSVERMCEYALDLPQEAAYNSQPPHVPPQDWPTTGRIDFNQVSLAYRPGLPLVLRNLSFSVKDGEKIGICGRTGAGKSSIMTALYRLSELDGGSISIDGVDVSKIGLHDLRSALSIIPQDPVLFKGTVRINLDPFSQLSDDQLYDSLRRSGLIPEDEIDFVKAKKHDHKFALDQIVENDGSNFSLGERQLIALARALVRRTRFLILDEATSSVDYETDSLIQKTIVNEFGKCTILCIAHRLKTILNYDKILVLDKGEIIEFDKPINLFRMKGGIFRSMCDRSKITTADFQLSNIAT
ncbi:unnamed protein product [Kuraishia capsulata CBS 1993]|uniref:Oligomycin resistance ATP-dependent permease YOR1 n=1 Tax=Kuraishia capsulata CBS 1993 TaxID=1382522 RepID=W6MXT0_9ASCO|nr:uncharacterized protein KUCA_T00005408001 [Kuraishia capsulata CBS 1993]CDK29420.1 unnamed protein product [Kuraishia capsulata CBS 1993]